VVILDPTSTRYDTNSYIAYLYMTYPTLYLVGLSYPVAPGLTPREGRGGRVAVGQLLSLEQD
jgi:hypothetical protein